MSQEAPKAGRLVEMTTPEIPLAGYAILTAETEEGENGKITALGAQEILEGDCSLGMTLIADGIIISERQQGKDVVLIHNPEDEVVMPDNILEMGTGDDDEE